jgi:hypothetical protein
MRLFRRLRGLREKKEKPINYLSENGRRAKTILTVICSQKKEEKKMNSETKESCLI